ncbi:hypothetical protein WOLCODRAFT_138836 [Wolfiporia cocos MD-104 SS10]|uniref:Zn(2)-C6 fungal-type domain-containing protein n=1 Tax=Wolfiporia cocos (strain MD-104) TaxID=742152 RepID=A0A2H3K254_WOLCO|nr:hypothetical protein WOLCODRAFT_138836 [Wolfiporia cocos MD-104 SS10]
MDSRTHPSLRPSGASGASTSAQETQPRTSRSPDARAPDAAAEPTTIAFVKGTKRKRLSKACDACHKSKRRCDGTAPCSNCYFASKKCTYTDSSGRPVPAPRNANANPDRPEIPTNDAVPRGGGDPSPPMPHAIANAPERPVVIKKRNRNDRSEQSPVSNSASSAQHSPTSEQIPTTQSKLLDPDTTHELVNLFFAHCNPHRLIFHKPSFSAALSRNRLPEYLVLVVCAVAAPLSKSISARASHARVAGVPFYEEAVSLMFDNAGRLLSEPSLATAQALCLMEMHEVAASHSWTKHYKYFDLALRVLEESLEIHIPDERWRRTASPPAPDALDTYIARECARRCFWLIQCMGWINAIYTYRPMRPRSVEMMTTVRLPIDETTFELAANWSSATSEYLHVAAPRTRYASQFGHVCRILSIYTDVQAAVASNAGPARDIALRNCRRSLESWLESLPAHLRFTAENMEKQEAMFETSSNTGAWCYCFMHSLYPCCYLALAEGEGRLGEPIPWVRAQLGTIFQATGTRAKNTILSACVLWSYSKYHPDDPQLHVWDRDFDRVWGFRVTVVANQWRQAQALERAQAAAHHSPTNGSPQQRETAGTQGHATNHPAGIRQPGNSGAAFHGDVTVPAAGVDHRFDGAAVKSVSQHQRPMFAPDAEVVQAPLLRAQPERVAQLPSLKASGLLDSWRPPSEAFANSLSISQPDERRAVATLLNAPSQPSRNGMPATNYNTAAGLDWLGDKP